MRFPHRRGPQAADHPLTAGTAAATPGRRSRTASQASRAVPARSGTRLSCAAIEYWPRPGATGCPASSCASSKPSDYAAFPPLTRPATSGFTILGCYNIFPRPGEPRAWLKRHYGIGVQSSGNDDTSNAQRTVYMTTALIIGSGAAAAGAALALSHRENLKITVIDIGLQLEADREQLVAALASSSPDDWDEHTVELISKQPVASRKSGGVPEKRVFGSDYPFRNVGQLSGLTSVKGANTSLISPAYGGFSNVWGSQIMPFTPAAFESWPVDPAAMRCHYEAILRQIPFAGEEDDLAARFPLMRPPAPLPSMAPRSLKVLKAYEKQGQG